MTNMHSAGDRRAAVVADLADGSSGPFFGDVVVVSCEPSTRRKLLLELVEPTPTPEGLANRVRTRWDVTTCVQQAWAVDDLQTPPTTKTPGPQQLLRGRTGTTRGEESECSAVRRRAAGRRWPPTSWPAGAARKRMVFEFSRVPTLEDVLRGPAPPPTRPGISYCRAKTGSVHLVQYRRTTDTEGLTRMRRKFDSMLADLGFPQDPAGGACTCTRAISPPRPPGRHGPLRPRPLSSSL